ncbi:MAG: hypothetical protein ACPGXZ_06020 [Saprospiraceae bacterium]
MANLTTELKSFLKETFVEFKIRRVKEFGNVSYYITLDGVNKKEVYEQLDNAGFDLNMILLTITNPIKIIEIIEEAKEEITFDNTSNELVINDVSFTLQSFDENEFCHLVEKPSKEWSEYFFGKKHYSRTEIAEIKRNKFKLDKMNGLCIHIYFDSRKAEHDFFKGKEVNILNAIQKGKQCLN